jgi:hypothetical protein
MNANSRALRPVDTVKTIAVDDTIVLVDETSGQYFGLNDVGAAIWRQVQQHRTVEQIVAAIVDEYDSPAPVVAADTTRLVSELVTAGLVS